MDAEGDVLAEPDGRSVAAFEATGREVLAYIALKKKVDAGKADKATQVDFFVAGCRLRRLKLAEAEAKAAEFKDLSGDQQKKVKGALVNLEIAELIASLTRDNQAEVAQKCYDLRKAGKVATAPDDAVWNYWWLVLFHCQGIRDVATYELGVATLKARFKDDADRKAEIRQLEQTLKSLKSGK